MKLTQLQYFCEVYRQRNVSRAAEKLNISQPSISAAIKELEGEFGIALFSREGRGIRSTPEGDFFYEHAQSLLTHADSFRMKMLDLSQREELRFGVPPMIGSLVLPALYGKYQAEQCNCLLRIVEGGQGNADGGAEEPPDRYGPAAPRHAFAPIRDKARGDHGDHVLRLPGPPAARQSERFRL